MHTYYIYYPLVLYKTNTIPYPSIISWFLKDTNELIRNTLIGEFQLYPVLLDNC